MSRRIKYVLKNQDGLQCRRQKIAMRIYLCDQSTLSAAGVVFWCAWIRSSGCDARRGDPWGREVWGTEDRGRGTTERQIGGHAVKQPMAPIDCAVGSLPAWLRAGQLLIQPDHSSTTC